MQMMSFTRAKFVVCLIVIPLGVSDGSGLLKVISGINIMAAENVPDHRNNDDSQILLPHRQHPFLFSDSQTFKRAKLRAEKYPWARREMRKIIKAADEDVKKDLLIPEIGGVPQRYYRCRKCDGDLHSVKAIHICEKCFSKHSG